jgi:hypothetical protein
MLPINRQVSTAEILFFVLGGACYVNIGMHLDFLPVNRRGEMIDPKKFKHYHCLFRERISWQGIVSYEKQWAYTRESAEKMVRYYLSETRPFLLHFRRFPEDFLMASPEDFLWHPVDMAEIYANISKYIGDKHTVQQFFEVA